MLRSISVRRSPIHGNGVFAARDLPAGKTLIEYRGKLCTHEEADEIYGGSAETGHTFLFTLNEEYLVDANRRGNAARWINHSCDPNCEAVIIEEGRNGHKRERIWIETRRAIRKGEELTYDYGIKLDVRHTERMRKLWACRCGTPGCIGTMLKPKKKKAKR